MKKELNYQEPEFAVVKTDAQDVLTTSGDSIVTPPWGGEVVINPEFLPFGL